MRRITELTALMDTLVALRIDLCKDGIPAQPADHLDHEAIKTLCYLATLAIDKTKHLIEREKADTPTAAE
jgi:hypothetical protein